MFAHQIQIEYSGNVSDDNHQMDALSIGAKVKLKSVLYILDVSVHYIMILFNQSNPSVTRHTFFVTGIQRAFHVHGIPII